MKKWSKHLFLFGQCTLLFFAGCTEKTTTPLQSAIEPKLTIVSQKATSISVRVDGPPRSTGRMTLTVKGVDRVLEQSFLNASDGPPWHKVFSTPANKTFYVSATLSLPKGKRRLISARGKTRPLKQEELYSGFTVGTIFHHDNQLAFLDKNKVVLLHVLQRKVLWEKEVSVKSRLLATDDKFIYLTEPKSMVALARQNGEPRWRYELKQELSQRAFICRKLLLLLQPKQRLFALNRKGKLLWEDVNEKYDEPWAVTSFGTVVISNGPYGQKLIDGPTGRPMASFELFHMARVMAGPYVFEDQTCFALKSGEVLLGRPDRSPSLSLQVGEEISRVVLNGKELIVALKGKILCYAIESGDEIWRLHLGKTEVSEMVCNKRYLAYFTAEGTMSLNRTQKGQLVNEQMVEKIGNIILLENRLIYSSEKGVFSLNLNE